MHKKLVNELDDYIRKHSIPPAKIKGKECWIFDIRNPVILALLPKWQAEGRIKGIRHENRLIFDPGQIVELLKEEFPEEVK